MEGGEGFARVQMQLAEEGTGAPTHRLEILSSAMYAFVYMHCLIRALEITHGRLGCFSATN
jgi:hypothetical protein